MIFNMKLEKSILKKTCSFCVSEYHVTTLLLPYITEKLKSNTQIITFFEEGIEENISKVLKSVKLEEYIKKEIMQIGWEAFNIVKYSNILECIKPDNRDINIIVNGSKKYIENINTNLEKAIESLNSKGLKFKINITINNCYHVREVLSVKDILDKHDLLLNTSGEVDIDTVFEDYKRAANM